MIPSRPWPRIVRGRTIVTSRPAATASRHSSSACELGPAVGLERVRRRLLGRPGCDSGMPKIALDDVCTTLPTPASRAASSTFAVPTHVHRPEQLPVLRQRHLGDVVEHHVDAVARAADGGAVADVALRRTRRRPLGSPGGFRSKMRTSSPRASACSARTLPK